MRPQVVLAAALTLVVVLARADLATAQAVGGGRIRVGQVVAYTLVPNGPAGWGTQYDEWTFVPSDGGLVTIRVESAEFKPMVDFGQVAAGRFAQQGWYVDYGQESTRRPSVSPPRAGRTWSGWARTAPGAAERTRCG